MFREIPSNLTLLASRLATMYFRFSIMPATSMIWEVAAWTTAKRELHDKKEGKERRVTQTQLIHTDKRPHKRTNCGGPP